MADLSSLSADQLAENVGVYSHRTYVHKRNVHKVDCPACALAELVRRLKAAEDALEQIAEPMPETEGDWGATYNWEENSKRRRDLARAALAAIRPNPKP